MEAAARAGEGWEGEGCKRRSGTGVPLPLLPLPLHALPAVLRGSGLILRALCMHARRAGPPFKHPKLRPANASRGLAWEGRAEGGWAGWGAAGWEGSAEADWGG